VTAHSVCVSSSPRTASSSRRDRRQDPHPERAALPGPAAGGDVSLQRAARRPRSGPPFSRRVVVSSLSRVAGSQIPATLPTLRPRSTRVQACIDAERKHLSATLRRSSSADLPLRGQCQDASAWSTTSGCGSCSSRPSRASASASRAGVMRIAVPCEGIRLGALRYQSVSAGDRIQAWPW